jgi:hypothetical protein
MVVYTVAMGAYLLITGVVAVASRDGGGCWCWGAWRSPG